MIYELKEVVKILKVYNALESQAKDFFFLASFPKKDKSHKIKSAKSTLFAIEEYKKLQIELRKELEKDTENYVSKIDELERLCKKTIEEYKS